MDLSRYDWRTVLTIATAAMLIQQAFSYVCQIAMPILADRLAEEFGISRGWLGFYLALQNVIAILAAIGCGGFILRYGPLRVSQAALVMMGGSLVVIASGQLWLFPLGAVLMGAAAVSTPASSHILARVCPPKLAPLVFSVKQTGVPVGALIGGLSDPFPAWARFLQRCLWRHGPPWPLRCRLRDSADCLPGRYLPAAGSHIF